MHLGTAIFVLSYLLIALGESSPRKLDRPTVALLGAVLMVVTGALSEGEAAAAIDLRTLGLLFGLMVLVAGLVQSGLPGALALSALARLRSPRAALAGVSFGAGLASALLLNDTVCLVGTPLVLGFTARSGLPARPYLLALATSANIGSVMTLTGNPQNVLIGHASGWGWSQFAARMAPIGLLCLVANWLLLSLLYGRDLAAGRPDPPPAPHPGVDRDPQLARRSAVAFGGFLLAVALGAPMAVSAVAAASGLLLWANRPPRELLGGVDWSLLLFFAGLFVIVAGLLRADQALAAAWLQRLGAAETPGSVAKLSAVSVLGSNLVSNVPFVLLAGHWVRQTPDARFLWLVLALTSTFAGNLTLLGSVANVIVAERARPQVRLGYGDFLRVGLPVTLVTTTLGVTALIAAWRAGWT